MPTASVDFLGGCSPNDVDGAEESMIVEFCALCKNRGVVCQEDGVEGRRGIDMMMCQDCGIGWHHSFPKVTAIPPVQDLKKRAETEKYEATSRFEAFFNETFGPGQVVLDVGCGTGAMMHLASERGAETEGVDIDEAVAELAREFGVVQATDVSRMKWARSYDIFTLFNVLERTIAPELVLETLYSHGMSGSKLFIETSNLNRAMVSGFDLPKDLKRFHKDRLWEFTPHSLRKMVENAGWVVEETVCFDSQGLVRHLHHVFSVLSGVDKTISFRASEGVTKALQDAEIAYRRSLSNQSMGDSIFLSAIRT